MNNILIAGGDMRQIYCACRLAEKHRVSVIGFDEDMLPADISAHTEGMKYNCAVLPVPPLSNSGMINTPCCKDEISPQEAKQLLLPDAPVFAGKYDKRLDEYFSGHEIIDYISCEDLSIRNAVPTAEGAVQIALEELPVTLSGCRILIAGLGRIGTALALILKGFGADITAAVRNARGSAKASLLGIKSVCIENMPNEYELVFNTVPCMIFSSGLLKKYGKDTLFIDLASKPGGIDFAAAQELGMKVIWALGLPGKTAPVTAGTIIADTIMNILSERSN